MYKSVEIIRVYAKRFGSDAFLNFAEVKMSEDVAANVTLTDFSSLVIATTIVNISVLKKSVNVVVAVANACEAVKEQLEVGMRFLLMF